VHIASKIGALAQLGERLICIQEVNGSIPLGSTILYNVNRLELKNLSFPLMVGLDI
jgi:hypothetical protein